MRSNDEIVACTIAATIIRRVSEACYEKQATWVIVDGDLDREQEHKE